MGHESAQKWENGGQTGDNKVKGDQVIQEFGEHENQQAENERDKSLESRSVGKEFSGDHKSIINAWRLVSQILF